ncbi:hypothetical protein BX616_001638 [Lobosporangium transversale]|uniref:Rrp15p-domain-containing protein n=1 Tax=Lobosporangium transversale TaxID=64571 RepID=A0A1Y2GE28_9FUNG|nr:Rrp15p-domain-containing protein [Lobosporangium transversale]KAF9903412.1 hypothetical protein BX616_001638 [Lobosporangium transversale]ORZ07249.1 Rrp15p-domain-containing protein [Lobosporangium transversale]|eukprot:XP_021877912.1 Rrp15p-domain-containing protein [Lobosporangium transversale]
MKRPSTTPLPAPKVRKQAPVDDYKAGKSKATPTMTASKFSKDTTASSTEPKSILKKPLGTDVSTSKPKGSISGASILKANTQANRSSSSRSDSKNEKPKAIAVRATRGDITGGMGRRKRKAPEDGDEKEVNSGDDSESENDGEDERESDDEEENDDDTDNMPTSAAKKISGKNTEENMAEAMSRILGSTLRKADASTPILAKSRGVERKLEEEKMEAKARRAITNEKKRLASKDRVKPDYTGMEYEKKLRKVATRGVVQLFNAIKAQQKVTEDLTEKARPITTNAKDKVANLTKTSFLDLLKAGTKVSTL